MKTIDFSKLRRQYMTVILNDKKHTLLKLVAPTKNVVDAMMDMKDMTDTLANPNEANRETMDTLYSLCALVLSTNMEGKDISPAYVSEHFGVDEIIALMTGYYEFIDELQTAKN